MFKIIRPPGLKLDRPTIDIERLEREMDLRLKEYRDYKKELYEYKEKQSIHNKYNSRRILRPLGRHEDVSEIIGKKNEKIIDSPDDEVSKLLKKIKLGSSGNTVDISN